MLLWISASTTEMIPGFLQLPAMVFQSLNLFVWPLLQQENINENTFFQENKWSSNIYQCANPFTVVKNACGITYRKQEGRCIVFLWAVAVCGSGQQRWLAGLTESCFWNVSNTCGLVRLYFSFLFGLSPLRTRYSVLCTAVERQRQHCKLIFLPQLPAPCSLKAWWSEVPPLSWELVFGIWAQPGWLQQVNCINLPAIPCIFKIHL